MIDSVKTHPGNGWESDAERWFLGNDGDCDVVQITEWQCSGNDSEGDAERRCCEQLSNIILFEQQGWCRTAVLEQQSLLRRRCWSNSIEARCRTHEVYLSSVEGESRSENHDLRIWMRTRSDLGSKFARITVDLGKLAPLMWSSHCLIWD